MLVVDVGFVIICSVVVIFLLCFVLLFVWSVCCRHVFCVLSVCVVLL